MRWSTWVLGAACLCLAAAAACAGARGHYQRLRIAQSGVPAGHRMVEDGGRFYVVRDHGREPVAELTGEQAAAYRRWYAPEHDWFMWAILLFLAGVAGLAVWGEFRPRPADARTIRAAEPGAAADRAGIG